LPAAAAILREEAMKPRGQRGGGQGDLFRARLEQIISLQHALVKLAGQIDWPFLEQSFGAVYTDAPGRLNWR
jgi:IS5 family transposase